MHTWNKIPDRLKDLRFWLTWQFVPRPGGKPSKKPNIAPGPWDSKRFYSYQDVLNEYDRCQLPTNRSKADGIGIAFTTANDIVGIDIDDVSIGNSSLSAEIEAILQAGKSGYIEQSVSRNGYHIIGTTSNKQMLLDMFNRYNGGTGGKSSDKKIELYIADRYFTVSGYTTNNNFGNIDLAIMLAWNYITQKNSVASEPTTDQRSGSITTQTSVAIFQPIKTKGTPLKKKIAEKRSGSAKAKKNSVAVFPPRPANAFSDEQINKFTPMQFETAVAQMYHFKPILKEILEIDGRASADKYYKIYNKADKDRTPSGFDMEITSAVMYWLYRYPDKDIIDFLKKSKLKREDKHDNYIATTVAKARSTAIEYYHAIDERLKPAQKDKLNAWIKWKKACAKSVAKRTESQSESVQQIQKH